MVKQIDVNGEHVLPLCHGAALVASKSEWGVWHVVKNGRCDCKGFQARGTCRHLRTVAEMNAPKPAPVAAPAPAPVAVVDPAALFLPERPASPRKPVPTFEQFFGVVA